MTPNQTEEIEALKTSLADTLAQAEKLVRRDRVTFNQLYESVLSAKQTLDRVQLMHDFKLKNGDPLDLIKGIQALRQR